MNIKRVDPIVIKVHGRDEHQVLVHLLTDEGVDGWGECCTGDKNGDAAFAVASLIEKGLAPKIVGNKVTDFRRIWQELYSATEWYGRRGLVVFALSGIDTALLDAFGKSVELPVSSLLGGSLSQSIPLYASCFFDMDNLDSTVKIVKKFLNQGYFGVKVGWGVNRSRSFGLNFSKDVEAVRIIRDEVGHEANLMIDVGRFVNWSPGYAIKMAKSLEAFNIFWLEEPLPQDDVEGLSELSRSTSIPIATGEGFQTAYEFRRLLESNCVDIVQPDIGKVGGISEAKRIADLAQVFNRRVVTHNWSTAINVAAAIHLVASSPAGILVEYKDDPNPFVTEIIKSQFSVDQGRIQVPTGPGLGIEIDEDVITKSKVSS